MPARRPHSTFNAFTFLLAVACFARTTAAEERFAYTPVEAGAARLFYQDGVPIAVVSGTPEEIARQHAAILATPAKHVLTFPRRLANEFGADTYWPLMVGAANLLMHNAP
jgi:hypothetical protein